MDQRRDFLRRTALGAATLPFAAAGAAAQIPTAQTPTAQTPAAQAPAAGSSATPSAADLAIPALPVPTLPIVGSQARFPVRRIYCVGRNYLAHVRELNHDTREPPFFFQKQRDMLVQNGETIAYPPLTHNFHHELELVVAMRSGGSNIAADAAREHIFGYAIGLDMTRRDLQNEAQEKRHPWEIAKSFEQSAPCSAITPIERTGYLAKGHIRLMVNDKVTHDADLDTMIWNVGEIIAHLSTEFEVVAGDLIFTGTPEGVGPVQPGDVMLGTIDGLGELRIEVARS